MTSAMVTALTRSQPRARSIWPIIGRRAVQTPVVLLVVSALLFWLVQIVPGDPGRVALGPYAADSQIVIWKQEHGLSGSITVRYFRWLGGFFTGKWGTSLTLNVPVRPLIFARLYNTVLLGLYAFVVVALVGVALGFYQGLRAGSRKDRAITILLVSISSIPDFAVGTVLLVGFGVFVHWFPVFSGISAGASLLTRLHNMTLPAFTLAAGSIGYVARMTRAGTVETLRAAFYRTAVLKGLVGRRVLSAHVARNSLIPSVAVLGSQLAFLLGGSVIVETLFNYPGIGLTIVTAVQDKDLVVLESAVMVTAALSILVLLLTDLAYLALDPRIDLTRRD